MNTKNLHALIDKYEENYYMINGSGHDEKFKWAAVRGFRDVWFSEESKGLPFSKKFDLAMKHSSIMINNSIISPTNGIVKMAEERPEEIESLFTDLLYASYSSVEQLQDHMDIFLDKTEEIRQKLFPRFYRYKQDRHAASCYLAFFSPRITIYIDIVMQKNSLYTLNTGRILAPVRISVCPTIMKWLTGLFVRLKNTQAL